MADLVNNPTKYISSAMNTSGALPTINESLDLNIMETGFKKYIKSVFLLFPFKLFHFFYSIKWNITEIGKCFLM